MADAPRITVDELKRRMDAGEEFTVIDVRNPQEWGQSEVMLPGAIRLPMDELDKSLARIPRNKPVVAYCT
jgi:rhodanese-related sulfurtransferase